MIDKISDEWEILVGRYILLCGHIELGLCQLYWNLMLGKYPKIEINKMSFKEKTIEIRNVLKTNEKSSKELGQLMDRIITVTERRNFIAHNPLYLDIFMSSAGEFNYIKTIRSLRDGDKHITIDGLTKEIKKASDLSQELINQVIIAGGFGGENA